MNEKNWWEERLVGNASPIYWEEMNDEQKEDVRRFMRTVRL